MKARSTKFPAKEQKKKRKVILPEPPVIPDDPEAIELFGKNIEKLARDVMKDVDTQTAFSMKDEDDTVAELHLLVQKIREDPHSLEGLDIEDELGRYISSLKRLRVSFIQRATALRQDGGNLRKAHHDLSTDTDHISIFLEAVGCEAYPLLDARLHELRESRKKALRYAIKAEEAYDGVEFILRSNIEPAIAIGEDALAEYLAKESASASDDAK